MRPQITIAAIENQILSSKFEIKVQSKAQADTNKAARVTNDPI